MATLNDTLKNTLQSAENMSDAAKIASAALGIALSYIAPFQAFLITIIILVIADIVTGIWASLKRGEKFTASKLKNSLGKAILYPLSIILSNLMVQTFFADVPVVSSLTYIVALFISAVEFQSNIENIGSITGIDIWSRVKDWLSSRMPGNKKDPPQTP